MNSPADGASVSLLLGCKGEVQPLVNDFFIHHVLGSPDPLHECHLLDCSTFLEVGPHSFHKKKHVIYDFLKSQLRISVTYEIPLYSEQGRYRNEITMLATINTTSTRIL